MNTDVVNQISQHLNIRQNLILKSVNKFFYQLNFTIDWTEMVKGSEIMADCLNLYTLLNKTNNLRYYQGNFTMLNIKSLCYRGKCLKLSLLPLTELKLDNFSFEIKELHKLTGLTKLSINSKFRYNVEKLTNLTELSFTIFCPDLSKLSKLRKLELTDIYHYVTLPRLASLSNLKLTNVRADLNYIKLTKLVALSSRVENISPTVKQLKVYRSALALYNLTNLTKLNASHISFGLETLTSLTSLKLTTCSTADINLPSLTSLNIDNCDQNINHLPLTSFTFDKITAEDFELPNSIKTVVCREILIQQASGLDQLVIKKKALKFMRNLSEVINNFTLGVKCVILNVVEDVNVVERIEELILSLSYRSYNNRTILEF